MSNCVTPGTVTWLLMDGKTDLEPKPDRILDIVVELLETEGYDAVQLREVARRARTSLATI
jgi:AcrR family transcriptional regulator